MFNLFRPIPRKSRAKLKAEDFNDKVIVDFYKSLGIQLQALPDNVPLTSHSAHWDSVANRDGRG
ncbi:hypothetical protein SUGI_0114320 [Cryptomeria japonica]|nr:hypothetical protein SUGI_0114320 [Cryptomeria japonica]